MEDIAYDRLFQLEERNWWFVARRELLFRLVGGLDNSAPWLDVGCGTGILLSDFQRRGVPALGVDSSSRALSYARQRGLDRLVQASGTSLPLANDSVGVASAIEYFEHVRDDATAMAETFRVLRPGGILVLTVPAHPSLWGHHDRFSHHFRRYRRVELISKLEAAGFVIDRCSYAMGFLFPFVWAARRIRRGSPSRVVSDVRPLPRALDRALLGLMRVENEFLARHDLAFGVSLVARARKPSGS